MPRKVFVAGEILTAADVNTNLMDQAVMSFAGTAARGSAIPSPVEGMVTYLNDSDSLQVYNGSAWGPISSILQVVSTTKTDTYSQAISGGAISNEITGLTATITPSSATSKILVQVEVPVSVDNDGLTVWSLILQRGGSAITGATGDAAGSRTRVTSPGHTARTLMQTIGATFLDSPGTTSPITYGVKVHLTNSSNFTLFVNRASTDSDAAAIARAISTITLMEVAA